MTTRPLTDEEEAAALATARRIDIRPLAELDNANAAEAARAHAAGEHEPGSRPEACDPCAELAR